MSKRRTKKDKLLAKHHNSQISHNIQTQSPKQDMAPSKATFYTPTLELPMDLVRKDLTKTLIVTILAVIVQMCLAYYLNHGGWTIVNSVVINKLVNFG